MRIRREWVGALALAGLVSIMGVGPLSAAQSACTPTEPDTQGPFYQPNAPERDRTGQGLVVAGAVRSASGCGAIAGARIEWWSANPRGRYDDEHRATQRADGKGRYRYETDFPAGYAFRPSHLHVRVTGPGHRTLVTQIYPKPGETSISFDFVLIPE